MTDKKDFFNDLSSALESWTNASTDSLTNESANLIWTENTACFTRVRSALLKADISKDDIRQIFQEVISGVLISTLTTIDGGTALAEKGFISLVDEFGNKLSDDLHNEFVEYLFETGIKEL